MSTARPASRSAIPGAKSLFDASDAKESPPLSPCDWALTAAARKKAAIRNRMAMVRENLLPDAILSAHRQISRRSP